MNIFQNHIINLYGDRGQQWLLDLPSMITALSSRHHLSNLKPVDNLSYNYVLSGFQHQQPIIVKLGLDIESFKRESLALKAFEGFGVSTVLAEDDGLLLLACARPGTPLKSYFPLDDSEATRLSAKLMQRLHAAPIPDRSLFPRVNDWLLSLDNTVMEIPEQYLVQARHYRNELLDSPQDEVLLHGDLHHDNILQHENGWMVIDPKGVIGDPIYETTAFIRNPIPALLAHKDAAALIQQRIRCFSEFFKCSEARIVQWCFVQAVLSWIWALEDKGDPAYFKALTEFFYSYPDS